MGRSVPDVDQPCADVDSSIDSRLGSVAELGSDGEDRRSKPAGGEAVGRRPASSGDSGNLGDRDDDGGCGCILVYNDIDDLSLTSSLRDCNVASLQTKRASAKNQKIMKAEVKASDRVQMLLDLRAQGLLSTRKGQSQCVDVLGRSWPQKPQHCHAANRHVHSLSMWVDPAQMWTSHVQHIQAWVEPRSCGAALCSGQPLLTAMPVDRCPTWADPAQMWAAPSD